MIMHQVPDLLDMDKISLACDRVMRMMKERHLDGEDLEALAELCKFVHHIKKDVIWLETYIKILREKPKKAS